MNYRLLRPIGVELDRNEIADNLQNNIRLARSCMIAIDKILQESQFLQES